MRGDPWKRPQRMSPLLSHVFDHIPIATVLGQLRSRLADVTGSAAVLTELEGLRRSLNEVSNDLSDRLESAARGEAELRGQVLSLRETLADSLSGLSGSAHTEGGNSDHRAPSLRDPAIRSLTTIESELRRIGEQLEPNHAQIIEGQRRNAIAALSQLGVMAIEPEVGSVFDPAQHRSGTQNDTAASADSHETISRVVATGWRLADETLLRPADVVLRLFVEKKGLDDG